MRASDGRRVVVCENRAVAAYELGADVSPTGSAGLAALVPTAQHSALLIAPRVTAWPSE